MVMPRSAETPTSDPIPEVPTFTYPDPGEPAPDRARTVRRTVLRWLRQLNRSGLRDACAAAKELSSLVSRHGRAVVVWSMEIAGAAMIAAGVAFIHGPSGLIVAGILVILIAVFGIELPPAGGEEAE